MSEKYELIHRDCVEWMNAQKDKSIDCVITSPPYNLNMKTIFQGRSTLIGLSIYQKILKEYLKMKDIIF